MLSALTSLPQLLFWLAVAALTSGCGTPSNELVAAPSPEIEPVAMMSDGPHPSAETVHLDGKDVTVIRALPAGSIVRLLPVRLVNETLDEQLAVASLEAERALAGLWRVALSQSDHLDIAAAGKAAPAGVGYALQLTIDGQANVATATLLDGDQRVHLGSTPIATDALLTALDELALRTRLALGDPAPAKTLPLASAYSTDLRLIAVTEAALESARDGEFRRARDLLLKVRRRDGACVVLLDGLANSHLALGNAAEAEQIATEALGFPKRLTPTATHHLLRTLLLARSTQRPRQTKEFDQQLLNVAKVAQRERPHDPAPLLTAGIALNLLGDHEAAREVLLEVVRRMPGNASGHYHLGWAELLLGNSDRAVLEFNEAAIRLPIGATIVPRALALFSARQHDELDLLLASAAEHATIQNGPALHELRRMQAAHALLRGEQELAGDIMLADLAWLLERPHLLRERAGELADIGEVLVRLGRGRELLPMLRSMQRIDSGLALDQALADTTTYLMGLTEISIERQRIPSLEDALTQRGATVWAHALAAYGHQQRGELTEERRALSMVVKQSSSPLAKAALVRNLQATGQATEAVVLRDTLRRELETIELRRRIRHPLRSPEYAMAWLVE